MLFFQVLIADQPVGIFHNETRSMDVGYNNSLTILQLSDDLHQNVLNNNPWYYPLFQVSLESYLDLVRHEYYGHGSRAREYRLEKSYDLPFHWPVSMGGFFNATGIPSKGDESFMLTTAGMESGTYFAYKYQKLFLSDPDFAGRHFFYYLFSKGDLLYYAYKTNSEHLASGDIDKNSDIHGYYVNLDNKYPSENILACYEETNRLTYQAAASVYDLTLFGIVNFFEISGRVLHGENDFSLHMPNWKLFGRRFLPGTRAALTPWGVEYYLDMYFLQDNNSVNTFYVRQSDRYLENFWGGGFELDKLEIAGGFSYGLGLCFQPAAGDR